MCDTFPLSARARHSLRLHIPVTGDEREQRGAPTLPQCPLHRTTTLSPPACARNDVRPPVSALFGKTRPHCGVYLINRMSITPNVTRRSTFKLPPHDLKVHFYAPPHAAKHLYISMSPHAAQTQATLIPHLECSARMYFSTLQLGASAPGAW